MSERDGHPEGTPELSVIIPVYDRWPELEACLDALAGQEAAGACEVIVVDDGSRLAAPPSVAAGVRPWALQLVTRPHAGIAAARNAGIARARGRLLVFVDSDVVVAKSFLREVAAAAAEHPQEPAFQARLTSASTRAAWRIEAARLAAIQEVALQPDGRIAYLNTSACCVRSSYARRFEAFFEPRVPRGEDTLVLARLAREGLLPRFVPAASAEHRPTGTLGSYLLRHVAIGYHLSEARSELATAGSVLLSPGARLRLLALLLRKASDPSSATTVALTLVAYALELCGRAAGRLRTRA